MTDAIIKEERHYFCGECDRKLDACIICNEPFDPKENIKCTTEGHVHIECYE
jgi:hypothetical protein